MVRNPAGMSALTLSSNSHILKDGKARCNVSATFDDVSLVTSVSWSTLIDAHTLVFKRVTFDQACVLNSLSLNLLRKRRVEQLLNLVGLSNNDLREVPEANDVLLDIYL